MRDVVRSRDTQCRIAPGGENRLLSRTALFPKEPSFGLNEFSAPSVNSVTVLLDP